MNIQFKAPLQPQLGQMSLRSERERDPQTNTLAHFLVLAESKIISLL